MVTTMGMIALMPFTKLSHILMSMVNTFTQRLDPKGALRPIAFDKMENAESFGISKVAEFTAKQRLSVDTCVECGRCEVNCPAFQTQKPLSPKQIVVKLRDRMWAEEKDSSLSAKTLFETGTINFDELFSCTTCGACVQECPVNIEHIEMILDMRRHFVMTQGQPPGTTGDMVKKVQLNGNPWGVAQEDRMKWAEGMDVPVADPQTKIDYLYYVGCAGSYDDRNKKVVRTVVDLLKRANVSFAVIGKDEKCNGDPVRRIGDEYSFNEIAVERVEQIKQYKFNKVITHCPHCFHTIGSEYKAFGGNFETIHHSQLLAELIAAGRLPMKKSVDKEVVFHDPCYLGRHHGEYDAPREVLKAIPGLKVQEAERNKEKSFCCGMGGGNMWYEMKQGTSMTAERMSQLKNSSKKIASSCSFCLINFEFGKSTNDKFQDMTVQDISELVKEAIE
jgi:Fe-S oxidoreductase